MKTLIFPGRHLATTAFQAKYLGELARQFESVIFPVTSANQANCRYNPIPFYLRAIGIDRFAQSALPDVHWRIIPIPHFQAGAPGKFCQCIVKECEHELGFALTPENAEVVISTPGLMEAWAALGFVVHNCEQSQPENERFYPVDAISAIGGNCDLMSLKGKLSEEGFDFFRQNPQVVARIRELWSDPLVSDQGDIFEGRYYDSYSSDMLANMKRKFEQIEPHIRPGRIVDEGCADGALIVEIAKAFPDSDLYGIDISTEFAARFSERQRRGEFGMTYVHFHHGNLMKPLFRSDSIDTIICNSTLHEIYSYAGGELAVREYLAMKVDQLVPGGRLIARDVVGPDANIPVYLKTAGGLSKNHANKPIFETTISERFLRFLNDYKHGANGFVHECREHEVVFTTMLATAMEFAAKVDYLSNWHAEMAETFCFWSHAKWKQVFADAGLLVLVDSVAYAEPWLVQNRFTGRISISTPQNDSIPWPPTNHLIVSEKKS